MHLLDKLKRKPKANEPKAFPLPNWAIDIANESTRYTRYGRFEAKEIEDA